MLVEATWRFVSCSSPWGSQRLARPLALQAWLLYDKNMSASTGPKNKGGRPRVERDYYPSRSIRLSDDLVARVDRWASGEGIKRSEAIRRLVEQALAAKTPKR
jgi:hypothetical protein